MFSINLCINLYIHIYFLILVRKDYHNLIRYYFYQVMSRVIFYIFTQ